MRTARYRDDSQETVYVLSNTVCGPDDAKAFGPKEKRRLTEILDELQSFFTVRVLSCSLSSRGFRIICAAPQGTPSRREVAARAKAYAERRKRRFTAPTGEAAAAMGRRMRDISCFSPRYAASRENSRVSGRRRCSTQCCHLRRREGTVRRGPSPAGAACLFSRESEHHTPRPEDLPGLGLELDFEYADAGHAVGTQLG